MNKNESLSSSARQAVQIEKPEQKNISGRQQHTALGYLRAFVIVLVVAQHAVLAYFPFLPASPASSLVEYMHSIRMICPVNDEQRSMIFFLFNAFNDKFFMSLMFFLSGLFVWKSIQNKGKPIFFRDRLIRLGLPFIVMTIISPVTYYTSYLQTTGKIGLSDFWRQWISIGDWASPGWFLWLLLIFDIIAVLLPLKKNLFNKIQNFMRQPVMIFIFIILLSAAAYLPMALNIDPNNWRHWGPFKFQTSRIFLYLAYFLAGIALSANGIERTFLKPIGPLARYWIIWIITAIAAFIINIAATFTGAKQLLVAVSIVLSCAASSFAFLAIFLRFANNNSRIFDSLSANSYGIFVIHYGIAAWLQYSLLKAQIPAVAKGSIVFVCALALCWGIIAAIRRIPGVARVI